MPKWDSACPTPPERALLSMRLCVQIYEVQTPAEAEMLLEQGVDHIGSVVVSETDWRIPQLRETISVVGRAGGVSSLIPLYRDPDTVFRTLDYYGPDIVHFCDNLSGREEGTRRYDTLVDLQARVRQRFPEIRIMRSIPIPPAGSTDSVQVLETARAFEPVSDYFLTDTILISAGEALDAGQPVAGFVGITGRTCDWEIARELTAASKIPVILAGGLSPENVYEGILSVRPYGVDSCTLTNATDEGGEQIRFCKDIEKVHRFVSETRRAEKTLGRSEPFRHIDTH